MKKKTKILLWVRRTVIILVFLAFAGWLAHWYLEIESANARVAAANARLETFITGRAAMQDAAATGDYRAAITDGLALRATIALEGDENVDVLSLEGYAYFKLSETAGDAERLTDLRASRDAYEGALAGLDGAEDGRYASFCFSLGGVYFALADYGDRAGNLRAALDYYRKNAAYAGPQDAAVRAESYNKIIYIQDQL